MSVSWTATAFIRARMPVRVRSVLETESGSHRNDDGMQGVSSRMLSNTLPEPLEVSHTGTKATLDVLILDDLEADRMRLRRFCRKAGLEFELHEASDLQEFRSIINSKKMDLVFLDYHLAMDNGLDALKILRAQEDQVDAIPIMVTSVDRHDIAVEAMRSGCADYITKEELSVDSIRKSIISAFERRILISALNEAQSSQHAMRVSIFRLAKTCGPEIRTVLAATLRHTRTLRATDRLSANVHNSLGGLEKSCGQIYAFLDEVSGLLEHDQAADLNGQAPTAQGVG